MGPSLYPWGPGTETRHDDKRLSHVLGQFPQGRPTPSPYQTTTPSTSHPNSSSALWATHSLAPGKRGWPPTSNHHVALAACQPPYPTPSSATRNWVRLACVRCYEMLRFWAFLKIWEPRFSTQVLDE